MYDLFPELTDKPDSQMVGAALSYTLAAFLVLPFFLLIFAMDFYGNEQLLAWIEIGFHAVGFGICVMVFRSYLSDCFLTVRLSTGAFLKVTIICTLVSIALFSGYISMYDATGSVFGYFSTCYALPIAEKNLLTYPLNVILENPVLGILCMTVLTPVTTSCLYYGAGFAPVCYRKPWLAYPVVTALIALPRLANCLTFRWDNTMELVVLLAQMPLHWIACYAYQKTDSIWAPIVIHAATNLVGCVAVLFFFS